MRTFFLSVVLFGWTTAGFAQDKTYAKQLIDTLASPAMYGRGYVNGGDRLAAAFIEHEMRELGLKPLFANDSYVQGFRQDVNTFSQEPLLQVDGKKLQPGKDYIIHPYSGELVGTFGVQIIRGADMATFADKLAKIKKPSKTALVLHAETAEEFKKMSGEAINALRKFSLVVLVNPTQKLTWTVSDEIAPGKAVFEVRKEVLPDVATLKKIKIACRPEFKEKYESRNVAGFVEGNNKDSLLLVTAHYDHLGKMGSALFPGASDNASGTSMMLNLAKFYAGNLRRPKYSIAFVAFAGEEAGLKGSKYFVEHSPMPLKNIRFVFNIDLMGGGSIGATVVNGSVFENEFKRMEKINTDHQLLALLKKRGKAANSDHYWFSENGVPAFFMYAEGGVTAYHDVDDTRENLPLTEYDDLFKLIHLFLDGF